MARKNLTGTPGGGQSPRVTIRLAPDEYAALVREADKAGATVTDMVRRAVGALLAARAD